MERRPVHGGCAGMVLAWCSEGGAARPRVRRPGDRPPDPFPPDRRMSAMCSRSGLYVTGATTSSAVLPGRTLPCGTRARASSWPGPGSATLHANRDPPSARMGHRRGGWGPDGSHLEPVPDDDISLCVPRRGPRLVAVRVGERVPPADHGSRRARRAFHCPRVRFDDHPYASELARVTPPGARNMLSGIPAGDVSQRRAMASST